MLVIGSHIRAGTPRQPRPAESDAPPAADRDFMVSVAGGWHVHLDILADHLNGRVLPPFGRPMQGSQPNTERGFRQSERDDS